MAPLKILVLSDGRPGHYHLAEGVAAAAGRLVQVETVRVEITRRKAAPTRGLRLLLESGAVSPGRMLSLGYGIEARALPAAGLVISAGGDTIAANVAAAAVLGAPNIFCGTLRHMAPERFALIVSSYQRHAGLSRHVVTLKPSAIDPDMLGTRRERRVEPYSAASPPARAALLIGGDSGLFSYSEGEWRRLIAFLPALTAAWGTRWLVSTSRRTAPWVADALVALADSSDCIEQLVDYRSAGPGTLPGLLARADMALCTEDSSTMISEAVGARLPVVGVAPETHDFKPEEAEYRALMLARGWARFLPLAALEPERLGAALAEVRPMAENHLDALARVLAQRLPEVFAVRGGEAPSNL
jgi:hypothetical protein